MRSIIQMIESRVDIPSEVMRVSDSKSFEGPNGNKAIAYKWIWKYGFKHSNREDGEVETKVSDHENSILCSSCKHKIVHVFWVKDVDGNIKPYGADHLNIALGYPRELSTSKIDAIKKKITNLDIQRKNDESLKKRSVELINILSGKTHEESQRNFMAWKSKNPGASSSPIWMINRKDKRFMRGDAVDVNRLVLFFPEWEVVSFDEYKEFRESI